MLQFLLAALVVVAAAAPASAVEYRLQVASVLDDAFRSFMKPGEAGDGATGPGLERLEASLDGGDMPKAVLLWDRHLQAASESTARAYGGVPVRADVKKGGDGKQRWDEVRWEGAPGEQSVWVVIPGARRHGELYRVALRGAGPIRHHVPYAGTSGDRKLQVVSFFSNFLWSHEEDADFWPKRVAPVLDLGAGVAVIVGSNAGPREADQAWVVVAHGAAPATYKVVLGWRERASERESPGNGFLRLNRR